MINRIIVKGYRRFDSFDLVPNPGMNIIVGDNESGKSTLLEAMALALTGKINGRWAREELNPFWFNQAAVADYFAKYGTVAQIAAPEILIELHLSNENDDLQRLRGVHNSLQADCPGVRMHIAPSTDYELEFKDYLGDSPPAILPVEFYAIDWRDFDDKPLTQRPKELATSFIDSRTIRSTSGVDYHTREMLSEHLSSRERAQISLAHRKARQQITDALSSINERIAGQNAPFHDRPVGLQMDQTSRTSWETGVVPQVDDIPFAMAGQGQQATIKVALAMSRTSGTSTFVLIEEPENHLSHTTLMRLVSRIETIAGQDQQLFVTTHSSFVLNRLGLDRLVLLHEGKPAKLTTLGADTVAYFRKLAGYDTLRLVLAHKLALVEGPSDAIVLESAFRTLTEREPAEAGVDILSMGGLTFKRALEVCACMDRQAVALQDNDGRSPEEITSEVQHLLAPGRRELLVSERDSGKTLEPQVQTANDEHLLRTVLALTDRADVGTWMSNNKTEAALRILDAETPITFPDYIVKAVDRLR